MTNLFYITFKRKKSNAKWIQNTVFVVSDKIFHCQPANSTSGSYFSSLIGHRAEKTLKKTRFPPQEVKVNLMTRLDELPNFNNPVCGMTSAVIWTDTDCHGQRTQQTSLIKAPCCTTLHVKHELSLLFPRG